MIFRQSRAKPTCDRPRDPAAKFAVPPWQRSESARLAWPAELYVIDYSGGVECSNWRLD